jgi:hypothetical protein
MALEESSGKQTVTFLLENAAVGFVLFWMVGVWLLPEKAIVLHNYRLYMSICVVPMSLGAYMFQKTGLTKKIGAWIFAVGMGCLGAFLAMSFYLF